MHRAATIWFAVAALAATPIAMSAAPNPNTPTSAAKMGPISIVCDGGARSMRITGNTTDGSHKSV